MPHRVTSFFRKSSPENPSETKSKSSRPPLAERAHTSIFPHLLDEDGHPKRTMPEAHKRLSFQGLTHSARSSTKSLPHQPAALDVVIESPPLVFYGSAECSTGALLSGQLVFRVNDESVPIESLSMKLCLETTRKRPFHAHCQECAHQTKDLTAWNFLQAPVNMQKGKPRNSSYCL
jgi:arrestin-related trafficking adapter 1